MTAEAVETLQADEGAELPSPAREEPQETERVTNGDGVLGPALFARRSARHEAEVDQRDPGAVKAFDEAGPESGMEAPTMNEDEMHRGLHTASARGLASAAARTSSKRSTSSSRCAAVKASLSRAVPGGTVGGLIDEAQIPASRSRKLMASAASGVPRMTGTICVVALPVSSPLARAPVRNRAASLATCARSDSMPGTISSAASMAPSTGGGSAVE